jgi:hypothetical protein
LGAKFFSHRMPGRTRDAGGQVGALEVGVAGLDRQQALVIAALRRAAGGPVSYAELRAAGVELPASVVSELELAGVAIERCLGEGRGAVGVRLDPANDPAARAMLDPAKRPGLTDAAPDPGWSRVRIHRASSLRGLLLRLLGWSARPMGKGHGTERPGATGRRRATATRGGPVRARPRRVNPRSRVLALAALLAAVALASALVAVWASGGDHGTRVPIAKRAHSRVVVAAGGARPASPPRSAAPAVPVSPALATELEAQGHGLLEAGEYGDAVPVLRRAVLATGESVGACVEPASSACLTYAYALYDLGRATRLNGEPQAAVPILERRLQIDNQRWIVSDELALARQGIG